MFSVQRKREALGRGSVRPLPLTMQGVICCKVWKKIYLDCLKEERQLFVKKKFCCGKSYILIELLRKIIRFTGLVVFFVQIVVE